MTAITTTLAKALNTGLRSAMEDDPKVIVMGEDVGKLGGVFRVTDGLQKDFGDHRVLDTPLAESGIIGTAVGLAMRGYRPVTEIQFDGFVFPGFDQIISQVAKITYRTQGAWSMPMVIRIPFGGGIGAVEHHAESPESFFCHIGGLRVVACSSVRTRTTCCAPRSPVTTRWCSSSRSGGTGKRARWTCSRRRRRGPAAAVLQQRGPAAGHRCHGGVLRTQHADPVGRGGRRGRPRVDRWRSSICAACRRWTWTR